ncbi:MAG: type IV secretion system protein [Steroidobacteraceae bacterium]
MSTLPLSRLHGFRVSLPLRMLGALALLATAPAAHAQWAVVDVGSIAQLVQEVAILERALATAQGELRQAEASYSAMTGDRGMENLLSGTQRNYLPTSEGELTALLAQSSTPYGTLASAMQGSLTAHAVLSPGQVAALPADAAGYLETALRTAALLQALAGDALTTTSNRFASLQQLVAAIPTARDQKGSLDLEARISAEQAMLQNDQTKLQVVFRAMQAERWLDREGERERVVADQGDFSTRFAPVP